jgi:hypothetical protein
MLSKTLAHAALRLALMDLRDVGGWGWIAHDPRSYVASCFEQNLDLLRTSRRLVFRVSPWLVTATLEDLRCIELRILYDALQTSRYELELVRTRQATTDLQFWVTSDARM